MQLGSWGADRRDQPHRAGRRRQTICCLTCRAGPRKCANPRPCRPAGSPGVHFQPHRS